MKKINSLYPVVLISMLVILSSSCVMKKKSGSEITKIVYRFGDSSVPPQYHRSYEITATIDSLRIVVDSYGTVLADSSFANSEHSFKLLTKNIKKSGLKNREITEDSHGCTGGTSKSIKIYSSEELLLSGQNYICGGGSYGDLDGDIESFATEIKKLIPNIQNLLQ